MQSSINHVVVLVVFLAHFAKNQVTPPPPMPLLAILPDRLPEPAIRRDDICIGLCGGKLAYCSCLLSLLHSFLSVTQFFNLYLLREGFSEHVCFPPSSFPLSETSCFIFMILHTFTPGSCRVQAQTLHSRSTRAVWRPHVLWKLVIVQKA